MKGPDGIRAENGSCCLLRMAVAKIFRYQRFSVIIVIGDRSSVTVIKERLKTTTAVEPAGDTIGIAERGAGKAVSIPMPK